MKTRKTIPFATLLACLMFLSFNTSSDLISDEINNENIKILDLEKKKTALAEYYFNLIKGEIDRRFDESKDGTIDEEEMIANLVTLTDYGCAFPKAACQGKPVCGVSEAWAQLNGSSSFRASNQACKPVDKE